MNTYSADGGAGVPPLTMSKAEDGTVYIDPLFSGIRLNEDGAKNLAKFLASAYKPVELVKDGE